MVHDSFRTTLLNTRQSRTQQLGINVAEIKLSYAGEVLMIQHLREGQTFSLGEAPTTNFTIDGKLLPTPASFTLVRAFGDHALLHLAPAMRGSVGHCANDQPLDLARACAAGMLAVRLDRGSLAEFTVGNLHLVVREVAATRYHDQRRAWDRGLLGGFAASTAILGAFLGLSLSTPSEVLALELDDAIESSHYARWLWLANQDDRSPEPSTQPIGDDHEGGGSVGQRHRQQEGQMGAKDAIRSSGKMAFKGHPDQAQQLARDFMPDVEARHAGILGVMQAHSGHFLAAVDGADFANGADENDSWGQLHGTQQARAYGVGGLGLVGHGSGGGGIANGMIGLSTSGQIGSALDRGSGGSSGGSSGGNRYASDGQGFADRRAHSPIVRVGRAQTNGGIGAEIIRRVVRSHENEIRGCYQQALAQNPNVAGKISLHFVITGSGAVASAVTQDDTLRTPLLTQCLTRAVQHWRFPASADRGTALVTYPFVFQSN